MAYNPYNPYGFSNPPMGYMQTPTPVAPTQPQTQPQNQTIQNSGFISVPSEEVATNLLTLPKTSINFLKPMNRNRKSIAVETTMTVVAVATAEAMAEAMTEAMDVPTKGTAWREKGILKDVMQETTLADRWMSASTK